MCAKRDASYPFVVRDGAWVVVVVVGGRKDGGMIGVFSHITVISVIKKGGKECGA